MHMQMIVYVFTHMRAHMCLAVAQLGRGYLDSRACRHICCWYSCVASPSMHIYLMHTQECILHVHIITCVWWHKGDHLLQRDVIDTVLRHLNAVDLQRGAHITARRWCMRWFVCVAVGAVTERSQQSTADTGEIF